MDSKIKQKFDAYPAQAQQQLLIIRAAIFDIAEAEAIGPVTETLKWGEPSFTVSKGSPVRMDWKPKAPEQVSVYFNCKTKLVDTFKEIYGGVFQFVGNREMAFAINEPLPMPELRACLSMSLRYQQIKHLPLLGV